MPLKGRSSYESLTVRLATIQGPFMFQVSCATVVQVADGGTTDGSLPCTLLHIGNVFR